MEGEPQKNILLESNNSNNKNRSAVTSNYIVIKFLLILIALDKLRRNFAEGHGRWEFCDSL